MSLQFIEPQMLGKVQFEPQNCKVTLGKELPTYICIIVFITGTDLFISGQVVHRHLTRHSSSQNMKVYHR